ncbi:MULTISPECIES: GntR family transcriptional regulator [unclassified Rhodococcus (in: high G+C Gram-positive bacteria)]|uniref:GntR family transcriptional regulator n=1 Tax=unclassified Rhodococcus (in: high G+C Gram-positive bacteria) TaxID=192944 RepID=UPI00030AF51C|nr:GntR family transcriptional regulator [Rhodococcus sp. DK17]
MVEALRESLASGAFRPGQRIAEKPLATRLGGSRGPIRDALNIVAEDGLIELEPHRGAYVPLPTRRDEAQDPDEVTRLWRRKSTTP